jgi:hypothetical protein
MSTNRSNPRGSRPYRAAHGPSDWERVNLHDRFDVAFWCSTLGCTQADLELAVREVGVGVKELRAWLAHHRGCR